MRFMGIINLVNITDFIVSGLDYTKPAASHWQTLSQNVVYLALSRIRNHNIGTDCIVSCKSNCCTITVTTAPILKFGYIEKISCHKCCWSCLIRMTNFTNSAITLQLRLDLHFNSGIDNTWNILSHCKNGAFSSNYIGDTNCVQTLRNEKSTADPDLS
jgi:hypothetical protein